MNRSFFAALAIVAAVAPVSLAQAQAQAHPHAGMPMQDHAAMPAAPLANGVSTTPADNAMLAAAPTVFSVTFPHAMTLTSLKLTGPGDQATDVAVSADASPATTVRAPLPPPGTRILFRCLGRDRCRQPSDEWRRAIYGSLRGRPPTSRKAGPSLKEMPRSSLRGIFRPVRSFVRPARRPSAAVPFGRLPSPQGLKRFTGDDEPGPRGIEAAESRRRRRMLLQPVQARAPLRPVRERSARIAAAQRLPAQSAPGGDRPG